ncbi:hypothetical protein [Massilia pseudoviolaceinigra]|uniref:hypothetical protein n=1 Tax=Massilia pseudoviolaceinigra TaxID=3057165 RepID=UPI002796DB11|nr:hypothetical protein [Massilia sp. CCM 9206]MDQ1921675.1 hypothetical protein [Massilia sp. CCM 9206]
MTAPQVIIVALSAMGVGLALAQNGQQRTGKHSFALTSVAAAIHLAVLYWGGFFSGGAA